MKRVSVIRNQFLEVWRPSFNLWIFVEKKNNLMTESGSLMQNELAEVMQWLLAKNKATTNTALISVGPKITTQEHGSVILQKVLHVQWTHWKITASESKPIKRRNIWRLYLRRLGQTKQSHCTKNRGRLMVSQKNKSTIFCNTLVLQQRKYYSEYASYKGPTYNRISDTMSHHSA